MSALPLIAALLIIVVALIFPWSSMRVVLDPRREFPSRAVALCVVWIFVGSGVVVGILIGRSLAPGRQVAPAAVPDAYGRAPPPWAPNGFPVTVDANGKVFREETVVLLTYADGLFRLRSVSPPAAIPPPGSWPNELHGCAVPTRVDDVQCSTVNHTVLSPAPPLRPAPQYEDRFSTD